MAFNKMEALSLLVALLALLLTVSAFAVTDEIEMAENPLTFFEETEAEPDSYEASGNYTWLTSSQADALVEHLYQNVKNAKLKIDVSQFKIPLKYFDDTREAWREMVREHRDVEYYAGPFTPGGSADSSGNYVGTLNITSYKGWNDGSGTYEISVSKILSINAAVDAKVDEIVSQMSPEMSDLERVLFVHDWLCINGEYDMTGINGGTNPRTSYDIRGILLYEIGVCQSYTWAFDYIMDRFDIPCINVTSDGMNHTWNQVKVGGYWYNMDITWDDPTYDKIGLARHYYFLCSDSVFKSSREHFGYYDGVSCSSTKYDNAFWYDVDTPMPYINGDTIYLKQTEGVIKAINIDTMSSVRTIKSISDGWYWHYDNRSGYKAAYFTNLAVYANRIYFNDAENIAYINPDGSGYTVMKSFSTSDGNKNIYGMRVVGSTLEYVYIYDIDGILKANYSINLFVPITSIQLPFENAKLPYNSWAMIETTVNDGADASRLIWTSSDPTVAVVEAGGKVHGLKCGTTVITATSPDNPSVKDVMNLTIYVKTTSISLSGNPANIVIGSTRTLKVTLNAGALKNDIVRSSSNSNVLSVDYNGVVTAKALGTATITAKSYDDPTVYATIVINVVETRVGDPSGDGEVNAVDAVLIAQCIAGWEPDCNRDMADVNRDGEVNVMDAVVVAQYIAGWEVGI